MTEFVGLVISCTDMRVSLIAGVTTALYFNFPAEVCTSITPLFVMRVDWAVAVLVGALYGIP